MSARRKLFLFPAIGVLAGLLWSTLGSFSSALGQEDGQPIVIGRAHKGALKPSFEEPIFFLVLGGDALQGNPVRVRTDSIHIVAIDPKGRSATIVGFPRDSYVAVPNHRMDKLTHAQYFVGTEGTVATIENLSGCEIDYHMLVSFQGFGGVGWRSAKSTGGIINDIGGVTLDVPAGGLNDEFAFNHGNVPALEGGPQLLTGPQALAWSRARYNRPGGDFDRSFAQGQLMIAILRELRKDFAENPGAALRAIGAARRNIRMNIGVTEALQLGLLALDIQPSKVTNLVVDGEIGSAGGASIVRITDQGRAQLVDVCTDGVLDNP